MEKSRRKKSYSLVKAIFRAEGAIKDAVIEYKTARKKDMNGGGGTAFVSDPTAGQAMRELEECPAVKLENWTVYRPQDWLRVIRLTYANTKLQERELMRRYFNGESISELASGNCGYEEPTLYVISRNFVALGVEIACQFGLIRVIDT